MKSIPKSRPDLAAYRAQVAAAARPRPAAIAPAPRSVPAGLAVFPK